MATSSIIENIRINNPKAVEAFVSAMEKKACDQQATERGSVSALVVDSERMNSFVKKGLANKGAHR